jgi:hypothetical protein
MKKGIILIILIVFVGIVTMSLTVILLKRANEIQYIN